MALSRYGLVAGGERLAVMSSQEDGVRRRRASRTCCYGEMPLPAYAAFMRRATRLRHRHARPARASAVSVAARQAVAATVSAQHGRGAALSAAVAVNV